MLNHSYVISAFSKSISKLRNNNVHTLIISSANREINNIRGFTRETVSALIVDIESREWRREYNRKNNIPLEHPRASTTDDVECFFSVLRDMVGKDFTHKEV